jgi:uncharacterized protein (DUF58 family)
VVSIVNQGRAAKFVESMRSRQALAASPGAPLTSTAAVKEQRPAPAAFDPQALNKLGSLELIATTVVDGVLSGKHRSTHKGGCVDFAEFRPYARGDDLRRLDWRHYAKSDRYYVKQYDDETNLQALLIVDTSGSMGFGMSTVTKWRYAQMASACLGQLLLRQRDSVGLALAGRGPLELVKPQPRPGHLVRLLQLLSAAKPQGESSLADALSGLTSRWKRRGMALVFSDCFGDVAKLGRALEQLRYFGHDVLVFQILAPEELTFPFRRDALFQDLELPRRLQVNPNALRQAYLREFQAFMREFRQTASDCGADLVTISTGNDLGDALSFHLRRRAAMVRNPRRTVRA